MLKNVRTIMQFAHTKNAGRCILLSEKSEKQVNISEKLAKIEETVNDYRKKLMEAFKDMEVDVKDWNFTVGKVEKQYNVEVTVKLTIKPKKM